MRMRCMPPPIATPCPGRRCGEPRSSWPSPPGSIRVRSPPASNATRPRSGGPASDIVGVAWRPCSPMGGEATRVARSGSPRCNGPRSWNWLACLEPIAKGLHITHWSSEDLARQAVADKIVPAISPATVRRILHDVDLQPHRTRYWKTARLDDRFKERAEQVLWCYGNAARLAERGIGVVCVDEIPTFQVRERGPIRRAIPGPIEQREFDYTRHGTVNMLVFLVVHSGLMELAFLAKNDAEHYLPELELFRKHHRELRGAFLIQDGGSRHIAGSTQRYFAASDGWWRPRYTPANASWLNQGEILILSFKHYYLKRASWRSQEEFRSHVLASWPEYNRRYAHPIAWTWTNQKMRQWFARHAPNSLQEL